ncbi:hypothetical protein HZA57_10115 [Candidatus Poribacteria bacterium]|nr:hypothetical protein [Candidatus Poribacteria bacterium]
MALDIYLGPLTRYYAGEWENVAQRHARENGLEYRVIREVTEDEGGEAITAPEQIRDLIIEWRTVMNRALEGQLTAPLDWIEDAAGPYYSDRPHWDGYGGLLLLAAYEKHTEQSPPEDMPEKWMEDPVLTASCDNNFSGTEYPCILAPELWLPGDFRFVFKFPMLSGREALISSTAGLIAQLELLNERTFKSSPVERREWRRHAPELEGSFAEAARFGIAVFMEMAERAHTEGIPFKLDY